MDLIAYSGVLLLWLGFKVGLKLELGWVYCGWVSFELPQMKLHGQPFKLVSLNHRRHLSGKLLLTKKPYQAPTNLELSLQSLKLSQAEPPSDLYGRPFKLPQ